MVRFPLDKHEPGQAGSSDLVQAFQGSSGWSYSSSASRWCVFEELRLDQLLLQLC